MSKTIKLLEEHMGVNLPETVLVKPSLVKHQKHEQHKKNR